jgi:hypothetical protein
MCTYPSLLIPERINKIFETSPSGELVSSDIPVDSMLMNGSRIPIRDKLLSNKTPMAQLKDYDKKMQEERRRGMRGR